MNDEREAADIRAGRVVVDRARGLELILSVVERINRSLVLEEVLPLVVDNAVKVVGGDRGFLLLDDGTGTLRCALARDAAGTTLDAGDAAISHSIVEDVFRTSESVCLGQAQSNDSCGRRASIYFGGSPVVFAVFT